MKARELLVTALTFFLVASGLGIGIRSLASARVDEEIQSAFVFLSTLRRSEESDLLDRVFSGDTDTMADGCARLLAVRAELHQAALFGPTFQPLAGSRRAGTDTIAATPEALAPAWLERAGRETGKAHGFVETLEEGRRLVYLAPLRSGGQTLAYLRVDYDLSAIDGGRRLMVLTVVITVLLTLALHTLLLQVLGRRRK